MGKKKDAPPAGDQEKGEGQAPASSGEGLPPVGGPEQGTETTPAAGSVDELPDWAQRLLGELRKENAGHRQKTKAAEDAAKAAEDARLAEEQKWQELAEKRAGEVEALKGQLAAESLARTRQEVAQAAGLPSELADRLRGEDREALVADAEALMKLVPQAGNGTPGATAGPQKGARPPKEVKSPGIRL